MDFSVTHHFAHDPEAVVAALLDQDFQRSLSDVESLKERHLESQEERDDGAVVRRTRCVLDVELPSAARRFIGNGDPAWIEEAVWHPQEHRWTWVVIPEIGGDLLEAEGHIEITAENGGTERVVSGRVKVNVPIYGGRVEGWIVDGIEHAYAEEAERLDQWIAQRENP
ncbi:MAG TPA: DUF2505 domain-containing protein [Actinomycetota bacterium]|nr:DUF2505 domain-containing protein [Actinomycetota bacterium]